LRKKASHDPLRLEAYHIRFADSGEGCVFDVEHIRLPERKARGGIAVADLGKTSLSQL
jgi:hypothetical protein